MHEMALVVSLVGLVWALATLAVGLTLFGEVARLQKRLDQLEVLRPARKSPGLPKGV